ncbi:MAG: homocysteine S-methyltransferase family protein [Peptococcaceae bacterium]|nr:homocysteine S-methyltransferase family protein [Peptococcaceae bacterium]
MLNLTTLTQDKILFFDGAMGTMLQQRGLTPGGLPELLNLSQPDLITSIHQEYVRAGADVVTTNTFQANELKLAQHSADTAEAGANIEDIVNAAIRCARASGAPYTALGVGPLGQLMEPVGTVSFEQAYAIFRRQMLAGAAAGADLILIETFSDLYEAKAAILAAKENTDLPVICSLTFLENGRTFVGCDALTAVVALQDLGADALGVNCSVGPDSLKDIVATLLTYARVPVIVQANAGMPVIRGDQAVYELTPEAYAAAVAAMARQGVRMVGGCCGTTPATIAKLREHLGGLRPAPLCPQPATACTSGSQTIILDGTTTEIGERLNPTGKPKMQQALRAGDTSYLINEALAQVQAGAQILDVNVGLPELDEPAVLVHTIRAIQAVTNLPLQIDSADPAAIAAAIRVYNGKPIINSVNGKQDSMEQIFPLVKKYGALVIGLTLDENGIPPTAQGRLAIARRLRNTAQSYGIPPQNLLIDCLVLTASAQQAQVRETLAAIRQIKAELNLKTVLGVSNVSFGLPNRDVINAAFLAAALGAGLDAAILNPLAPRYREILDAFRVLNNEDQDAMLYIGKYAQAKPRSNATAVSLSALSALTPQSPSHLSIVIEQGRRDEAAAKVSDLLQHTSPLDIINKEFIPALNRVGQRFAAGELFLPQLLMSAQAVQNGFAVINDAMEPGSAHSSQNQHRSKGTILLATVHDDIHDIGKNIAAMLLKSFGYHVIDLGKDVPAAAVVDAIRAHNIRLAGLSALMTTTLRSMKETIAAVRAAELPCAFMVGGAVLNEEYAQFVGAEYYAKDAMAGVDIANQFFADTAPTIL